MIGRLIDKKPRVATDEGASALLKELTEARAALAEAQARSQEQRLEIESRNQDVGLTRIQLRARDARIAALEQEISNLRALRRNEQSDEAKSESAFLTQMRAALAESEERSEERRVALDSRNQEVGLMRIQLRVRDARIAALEKAVGDSGGAFARRSEQIDAGMSDTAAALNDNIPTLSTTVAERDASIAALKARQLAEGATLAALQSDYARAIANSEVQRQNLLTLEAALAAADTRIAEERAAALAALELRNSMDVAIGQQRERIARLEADLAAVVRDRDTSVAAAAAVQSEHLEQDARLATASARIAALVAANTRIAEEQAATLAALEQRNSMGVAIEEQRERVARLEAELAAAVRDRDANVATAAAVQAGHLDQDARLATANARVLELESEVLEQGRAITALQDEARVSVEIVRALEASLHAAEASVQRLEADPPTKSARLDEPAEVYDDATSASSTHEEIPQGVESLFIRTDESEAVHVLGRKTTIGRTPDNDVRIDAQYISRHHAIIFSGPTDTIIEDLNSTNGVTVNGRRVQRQTLKDGDIVLVGDVPFRFAAPRERATQKAHA